MLALLVLLPLSHVMDMLDARCAPAVLSQHNDLEVAVNVGTS